MSTGSVSGGRRGDLSRFPWIPLRRRRPLRHVAHYEHVLGTSLELQLLVADRAAASGAEAAMLGEIDRLEQVFSGYSPDSELMCWQATRATEMEISAELAGVLQAAQEWRDRTDGAFNPAAEALTRRWEERAGAGAAGPTEAAEAVLSRMSDPLWIVDPVRSTAVRLTSLPVSLNAIAKGFIVDRACAAAAAVDGVTEVLLNVGGDIRHLGAKPVRVAIADPFANAENARPADVVRLSGRALATSGGYRRGFRRGDRWHSHIFDPRTGDPVGHIASASVIAPDAITADVLSTAFCVLQPAESVRLADSIPDVACLLIGADGTHTTSRGWRRFSGPATDTTTFEED